MDLLLSKGGGKEVGNAHLFWDRMSDGEGMNLAPAFAGASHGTKRLTDAEIERAYGRCRKKHPGSDYTAHLSKHGPANMVAFHPLLHSFMDYFDIAAPLLCARIVDVLDQINNGGRPMEEYSFYPDVQEGLRDMFMRTNFASDRGGFFPEMKVLTSENKVQIQFVKTRARANCQ